MTEEPAGPTPSQTVGPFFGFAMPFPGDSAAVAPGPDSLRVEGQMLDGAGEPVADGLVEVFSAGQFARCRTDPEGVFAVTVNRPQVIAGQAPHLEVTVFARGLLRHLQTRIYLPDEPEANAADPVLARVDAERRETLVGRQEGGVLRFDIRLQGEGETVFFSLDPAS